ncbi:hypothetical protein MCC01970_12830 [Bifidobacteriaceae bacterium MCC01970]|nr:hypothetical protein MCC01970_12830 [Bifidobacteriaceae bacterium MCC01970]
MQKRDIPNLPTLTGLTPSIVWEKSKPPTLTGYSPSADWEVTEQSRGNTRNTRVDRDIPKLPTLTGLSPSADWEITE